MITIQRTIWLCGLLGFLCFPVTAQEPLGLGFTYQGQLKQGGELYDGLADLTFRLYDAAAAGNLQGTQTLNDVAVTDGTFTVVLNAGGQFGANAFNGQRAGWKLRSTARCSRPGRSSPPCHTPSACDCHSLEPSLRVSRLASVRPAPRTS